MLNTDKKKITLIIKNETDNVYWYKILKRMYFFNVTGFVFGRRNKTSIKKQEKE